MVCNLLVASNPNPDTLTSGIGPSFAVVLLGRALSGIGGAGMTALVSIIIAGQLSFLL